MADHRQSMNTVQPQNSKHSLLPAKTSALAIPPVPLLYSTLPKDKIYLELNHRIVPPSGNRQSTANPQFLHSSPDHPKPKTSTKSISASSNQCTL